MTEKEGKIMQFFIQNNPTKLTEIVYLLMDKSKIIRVITPQSTSGADRSMSDKLKKEFPDMYIKYTGISFIFNNV